LLDKLAEVRPVAEVEPAGEVTIAKQNVITFAPEGARGVAAFVDGQKCASV
jgi:hypothetical protein